MLPGTTGPEIGLGQTPIWGPSTPASLTQSPSIHNVSTLVALVVLWEDRSYERSPVDREMLSYLQRAFTVLYSTYLKIQYIILIIDLIVLLCTSTIESQVSDRNVRL